MSRTYKSIISSGLLETFRHLNLFSSSFCGTDTLRSVELIVMLFPEADLPNSFEIINCNGQNIAVQHYFIILHINVPPYSFSVTTSYKPIEIGIPPGFLLIN